jgi:hypothetical protein
MFFKYWRSAVAMMLLSSFCCAVLPIPFVLVERSDTGSTEAFPCQSCGCGCKTAEQCWTNCCCFSPSERLAWAKKNNVSPPDYAVLSDTASSKTTKKSCIHCSASEKKTVTKASNAQAANKKKLRTAVSMLALKCQGKNFAFTHLPWLVPSLWVEHPFTTVASEQVVAPSEKVLVSIFIQPDTPPPKRRVL